MSGYIGVQPVPQTTQTRESFTATAGQTSFGTSGYQVDHLDVYLNGVKLAAADYTATNGSDIVLASGAAVNDILEMVAFETFTIANQSFTGTTTVDTLVVTNTVDGRDVSVDGAKLDTIPIISTSSTPSFTAKGDGTTDGYIQLNCSQNSHGIKLKAPPHSANASYTLTFPNDDGNAGQFLKTDGSGGLSWATDSTTDSTKLPLAGGAMTGAITTNSTFDGVDVGTRDAVLTTTTNTANAALPKAGGALTGAVTTNSTFDGVDIATRDAVLTTTTNTANAALPKAGGALTGVLTTNSNVGIGTSSPLSKLNVKGTQGNWRVDPDSVSNEIQVLSTNTANDGFRDFRLRTQATIFETAGAERMRIDSSGNVGIGLSSGLSGLNVNGTIRSQNTSSHISYVGFTSYTGSAAAGAMFSYMGGDGRNSGFLNFTTNDTERMRIDSSGNVGIGISTINNTYSSSHHLQIASVSDNNWGGTLSLTSADGSSVFSRLVASTSGFDIINQKNTPVRFFTNNTERMRIDNSGNLLVGKTALGISNVGHTLAAAGYVEFTRSGAAALNVGRNSSHGVMAQFFKDGSTVGSIGTFNAAHIYFAGSNTGIKPENNVIFSTNNAGSALDNIVDLAHPNHRFKDLYLSGGVLLGGTGSANKLEDYEEGTWTVGLSGTSTTVTNGTGYYTKVGNKVFFSLYTGACNLTSSSGTALVTGLPYAVKSGAGNYSAVSIAHNTMFGSSATVGQQAYVLVGNTSVIFNNIGSTANPSFVNGNTKYLMMAGSYLTN